MHRNKITLKLFSLAGSLSCHQQKQVPVYGYPSGPPAMGPPAMAIPVTMYPASGPVPVANV